MKSNLFIKSLLVALVAFGLAFGCYQLSGNFLQTLSPKANLKNLFASDMPADNQAISFANIDSIEISTLGTDIKIDPTTEKNGKLNFTKALMQNNGLAIQKINRTLTIKFVNKDWHARSLIQVSLPAEVKNLRISTLSGDIEMNHLMLNKMIVNTTSGDIHLNRINAQDAMIKTISGDIEWSGLVHTSDVTTVSGDFEFSSLNPIKGKLDAQSISGEVKLPEQLLSGDALLSVKSVSGDIHIANE